MSELEQLKADLEALNHSAKVFENYYGCESKRLNELQIVTQAKIKKLEATPDPFRRAKHLTEIQRQERDHGFFLADYAIHLEDEVERLKAELESRPVVWCLKSKDNGIILTYSYFALFESSVAAEAFRSRYNFYNFEPVIYTGKENE